MFSVSDIENIPAGMKFVDKIIVYQAEKVNGKQEQRIKIYYNCIGAIKIEPSVKADQLIGT